MVGVREKDRKLGRGRCRERVIEEGERDFKRWRERDRERKRERRGEERG